MEEKLLTEIQKDIPLVGRPFLYLARRLGREEDEVIDHLLKLMDQGIIRHFGPIFDADSLGYDSALVAFKVNGDLTEPAKVIESYPGVSHCYERKDDLNLWFTIAVPPDSSLGLEGVVSLLARKTGALRWGIFRKLKTFKLRVRLDFSSPSEKDDPFVQKKTGRLNLSDEVRKAVLLTQHSLPFCRKPFAELAQQDGMSEEKILSILTDLKVKGAMRRFSAVLNHRKVGFRSNALVVWQIPDQRIEKAGRILSGYRGVSHCYQRTFTGNFEWHYNLFSMIHGRSEEEVLSFTDGLARELEPLDYRVLFSGREFVKRRVRFFTEDYDEWERREH